MKHVVLFFLFFQNIVILGAFANQSVFTDSNVVFRKNNPEIYTLKSGKSFSVFQEPESEFLYDVRIIGNGFQGPSDTILFDEIEYVDTVLIADLDYDGFDELYIFTRGFKSGEYDHVFGIMSDKDISYKEIVFPEIKPEDFLPGNAFEGYNGKDVYRIKDNVLERTFPVHKPGDTYENPGSGFRTLYYTIEKNGSGCFYKIKNQN